MKPNIVLINCDDLGYGDFGCYGSTKNKTPSIDALAQIGFRCTDFYMASPLCSPSRGAMLTGCYPPRINFCNFHGAGVLFPGHDIGLNPSEQTISSMLHSAGYKTAMIGKWHCGDQKEFLPNQFGFDCYFGLPYSNDMGIQKNGNPDYPPLPLLSDDSIQELQPDQTLITDRYTSKAVEFIEQNRKNPFFLYLAHMHVHLPLYPNSRFKTPDKTDYQAAVEAIDDSTKKIVEALKKNKVYENTIIMITSDNGSRNDYGDSNGQLRGGKTTTWEGGLRVPCIISWEKHLPKTNVYSEIFTSLDFFNSLANICDCTMDNQKRDGYDYSPLFYGDTDFQPKRTHFFYYFMDNLEAVRYKNWKLHVRKNGEPIRLLYNLEKDVSESENLYGQYPNIEKYMEKLLSDCRIKLGDSSMNVIGKEVRPCGKVENPVFISETAYGRQNIIAMYDKDEVG